MTSDMILVVFSRISPPTHTHTHTHTQIHEKLASHYVGFLTTMMGGGEGGSVLYDH